MSVRKGRPEIRSVRTHCRLREIRLAKGMSLADVRHLTGLDPETLKRLEENSWETVARKTIERVCAALHVAPGELLVSYDENIWYPVRLHKEVTIHIGSDAERDGPPGQASDGTLGRLSIGAWDFRAYAVLQEHLNLLGDIRVRLVEHVAGRRTVIDFERSNNIFLGSTQVNQAAEHAVCWAHDVPTHTPRFDDRIPYSFVWSTNGRRPRPSSLGWSTDDENVGIAATATRDLVARHTFVPHGEGQDCAMIMAHRIRPLRKQNRIGEDDERLLLAILGHSGPGTFAGARAATEEDAARLLYPPECNKPITRVVRALTHRPLTNDARDNRDVTNWALL